MVYIFMFVLKGRTFQSYLTYILCTAAISNHATDRSYYLVPIVYINDLKKL